MAARRGEGIAATSGPPRGAEEGEGTPTPSEGAAPGGPRPRDGGKQQRPWRTAVNAAARRLAADQRGVLGHATRAGAAKPKRQTGGGGRAPPRHGRCMVATEGTESETPTGGYPTTQPGVGGADGTPRRPSAPPRRAAPRRGVCPRRRTTRARLAEWRPTPPWDWLRAGAIRRARGRIWCPLALWIRVAHRRAPDLADASAGREASARFGACPAAPPPIKRPPHTRRTAGLRPRATPPPAAAPRSLSQTAPGPSRQRPPRAGGRPPPSARPSPPPPRARR